MLDGLVATAVAAAFVVLAVVPTQQGETAVTNEIPLETTIAAEIGK